MHEIYSNLTEIGPNTDRAHLQAMMEANTTGVEKNNEGNIARKLGDFSRAEKLHREALVLKIRGFGEESIQAAISFNTLGETYLKMGPSKLDDAEKNLKKALRVRDDKAFGGLEMGPRGDAAVSRDNMGRLFEARGKMDEARAMRLRGAPKGEIMCGAVDCVVAGGSMLPLSKLQRCGQCQAVFYCNPACQKKDWSARHKPLCKAFAASKK